MKALVDPISLRMPNLCLGLLNIIEGQVEATSNNQFLKVWGGAQIARGGFQFDFRGALGRYGDLESIGMWEFSAVQAHVLLRGRPNHFPSETRAVCNSWNY